MGFEEKQVKVNEGEWWWTRRGNDQGLYVCLSLPAVAEADREEMLAELVVRAGELCAGEDVDMRRVCEVLQDEFVGLRGGLVRMVGEMVLVGVVGLFGVWVAKKNGASGWIVGVGEDEMAIRVMRGRLEGGDLLVMTSDKPDSEFEKEFGIRVELEKQLTEVTPMPVVRVVEKAEPVVPVPTDVKRSKLDVGQAVKKIPATLGALVKDQEGAGSKPWRRAGVLGVATLVVLAGVFVAGRYQRAEQMRKNSLEEKQIVAVVEAFMAAKAVAVIDRSEALLQIEQVQSTLAGLSQDQLADPRVVGIKEDLGVVLGVANGVSNLDLQTLVDLRLFRADVQVAGLVAANNAIWALDSGGGGRVLRVSLNGAVEARQAGELVSGAQLVAAGETGLVVGSKSRLVSCPFEKGSSCQLILEQDEQWGEVRSLGVWAGNVYVLDTGKGKIWKHTLGADGYGAGVSWIKDEEVLLDGAVSMTIDGNIWVFGKGGIRVFTQGGVKEFVVENVPGGWGEVGRILARPGSDKVYVWDKDNKRIVVLSDSGQYQEQKTHEELGTAVAVELSESLDKVYVTTSETIWVGEL